MSIPAGVELQHLALRLAKAARYPFATVPLFRPRCRLAWSDGWPGMYGEIYANGEYAPLGALPARPRILDIGGFLGLAAIWFLDRYPDCRLTCIEPNPYAFPGLKRAVDDFARRRPLAAVRLINAAVGTAAGTATLHIDPDQPVNVATNVGTRAGAESYAERCEVAQIDIRSLLAEKIDFAKIDIEGAEYPILALPEIAPDRVGEIAVEIHDIGRRRDELRALLGDLLGPRGYAARDRSGAPLTVEGICAGDEARVIRFVPA